MISRKDLATEYFKELQDIASPEKKNIWCLNAIKKISYSEADIESNFFLYHTMEQFMGFQIEGFFEDSFISQQEKIIAILTLGITSDECSKRMFAYIVVSSRSVQEVTEYMLLLITHSICTLIQMRRFLNDEAKQKIVEYAIGLIHFKNLPPYSPSNEHAVMILQSLAELCDVMPKKFSMEYFCGLVAMMSYLEKDSQENGFNILKKSADKYAFSEFKSLMQEVFAKHAASGTLLKENGYVEKINLLIASLQLKEATKCHFGINEVTRDLQRAYELYQDIPASAKTQFSEAQYYLAKLACYDSEFTPQDFKTETKENKQKRLLAMKPYLDNAAEGGHELAIEEKVKLDAELKELRTTIKRKADSFFQPGIANDTTSSTQAVDEEVKVCRLG